MWKAKESRRLRNLITELRAKHIDEWSDFDRKRLVQDVSDTLLISGDYFFFFFFCETFYFIHLIAQIWFINSKCNNYLKLKFTNCISTYQDGLIINSFFFSFLTRTIY